MITIGGLRHYTILYMYCNPFLQMSNYIEILNQQAQ